MPSLSPTHILVCSYFPSDHFFIMRKDHAMLLAEQTAQKTPIFWRECAPCYIGVNCLSLAPFAFLLLLMCVAAESSVSHDSPGAMKTAVLFLFSQMRPRGRHTHDHLRAPNRLAFVQARSVSIGAA